MAELTWRRSSRCEAHNCLEVAWQTSTRCVGEAHCVTVAFRRASRCQHADCVEVAAAADAVLVRDSKDIAGPVLGFTPAAWRAFTTGLQAGDLTP